MNHKNDARETSMDVIKACFRDTDIPYRECPRYIKISNKYICALLYPSQIGGMYAILYTDTDMFDYLKRTIMEGEYYIELQGITEVDRLVWFIGSRIKAPDIESTKGCIRFIGNIYKQCVLD